MKSSLSRLTQKYQATIPQAVREELGLHAGDQVVFEQQSGHITLRKAQPIDLAFTHAVQETMTEWNSLDDEEAYRDL
ncbi:AbrB/MazE/SpoVT family DNA-binding domain-containing protein [Alteromonas sp. LMIT006]|jgi:AbrB family looped-hinge helix DNA binding protein|uniref:AbrB/MazE/SpoVT family DNA-binding domain-containing protein n=1 Tax=Alteromonadaceae TaxID=72275 RepID=UPI0020CA4066|nr:AbrB/MazE/SpoVT family DNA-binding domain-containing protein [Alteromonas sp. LMIT006]UTP71885.1 AbrB/MazE/SpoVT family DNA-binding domain-containing protein [Alteromonas sp. LMIT006]